MHPLIEQHRDEIASLCRRFAVRRLEVFGSAARGADFDPATSDADFLVSFDTNADRSPLTLYAGLTEALQRLLGRTVDLVGAEAITNPYVLASINRSRQVIYGA